MLTGLGIGGEYAAINSAIDELIPARLRGRIDLIVNGSYWGGAAIGAAASLLLLSGSLASPNLGWRLGFAIGGVLGLAILVLRRFVPESPTLARHPRPASRKPKKTVTDVERHVRETGGGDLPPRRGNAHRPTRAKCSVSALFSKPCSANTAPAPSLCLP